MARGASRVDAPPAAISSPVHVQMRLPHGSHVALNGGIALRPEAIKQLGPEAGGTGNGRPFSKIEAVNDAVVPHTTLFQPSSLGRPSK
jgi:hypothetical protein